VNFAISIEEASHVSGMYSQRSLGGWERDVDERYCRARSEVWAWKKDQRE
jgi:predicted alpha-1,6-mannanase (GH76 family)